MSRPATKKKKKIGDVREGERKLSKGEEFWRPSYLCQLWGKRFISYLKRMPQFGGSLINFLPLASRFRRSWSLNRRMRKFRPSLLHLASSRPTLCSNVQISNSRSKRRESMRASELGGMYRRWRGFSCLSSFAQLQTNGVTFSGLQHPKVFSSKIRSQNQIFHYLTNEYS